MESSPWPDQLSQSHLHPALKRLEDKGQISHRCKMAFQNLALNATRLSQRITENFKESTRDLPMLQGNAGSSATYFDVSDDKLKDISKLLDSRQDLERLEGMKRLIAMISKGRDMESFFAQVVKNVASPSVEIRKLIYIYLLRYSLARAAMESAATNPDLLLLSINTFQRDLSDSSPLIRSMSLRVLASIRLPVIQGIVMIGLQKLMKDRNPWVRKTVAASLAKVYDMDTTTQPLLLPILTTLLATSTAITLGVTLDAWNAICPDDLGFLHLYYRRICHLLVDVDEWGQVIALEVLLRYSRAMLEKPENAETTKPKATSSDEQKGDTEGQGDGEPAEEDLDEDVHLLLLSALPLFQSRNSAVVLANVRLFYYIAPADGELGQKNLVLPLLRLMDGATRPEFVQVAADVCLQVARERPWLLQGHHTRFLVSSGDSLKVKRVKISILQALVSPETAPFLIREFKQYVRFAQREASEDAIEAVGHCARAEPEVKQLALGILMGLLKASRDSSVAQAVIVLKSLIQASPSQKEDITSVKLVAKLVSQMDAISNPNARACVFWLAGQYAPKEEAGGGREYAGLTGWAPDTLRKGVKGFMQETAVAKLQILTLAAKLFVLCPSSKQLGLLSQYVFNLARYDEDWDVRDRGRFLGSLLRGVRQQAAAAEEKNGSEDDDDDVENVGGVVLRKEQVKVVLMGGERILAAVEKADLETHFSLGSLSAVMERKLQGYHPLPEWPDEPTDPTIRDIEEEVQPIAPPLLQRNSSFQPPRQSPSGPSSVSGQGNLPPAVTNSPGGGPPGPARSKFKDLDAFLDEDSEEEESSEEEEEGGDLLPAPTMANQVLPPAIYVEDEDDEDTSEEEESSEDESEEEAPIAAGRRLG